MVAAWPRPNRRRVAGAAMLTALLVAGVVVAWLVVRAVLTGRIAWPFPYRPSLAVLEERDLRREVVLGLVLLAGAGFVWTGMASRRLRWPAFLLGLLLAWAGLSHLDLLLVPAYPTSYFTSPTRFAPAGIVKGAGLFAAHCAGCHGPDGRGGGPAAAGLPAPPADLSAEHLWDHTDGELFWWLTRGIAGPEPGTLRMPGFGHLLDDGAVWALIDFVRANNAGQAMRSGGRWTHPVTIPAFSAFCPGGLVQGPEDFRGAVIRLMVARENWPVSADLGTLKDARDVLVNPRGGDSRACAITDPDFVSALAIIAGDTSERLTGAQILVDPDGYLRVLVRRDGSVAWEGSGTDLSSLAEEICRLPVAGRPHRHVGAP